MLLLLLLLLLMYAYLTIPHCSFILAVQPIQLHPLVELIGLHAVEYSRCFDVITLVIPPLAVENQSKSSISLHG